MGTMDAGGDIQSQVDYLWAIILINEEMRIWGVDSTLLTLANDQHSPHLYY